MITHRVHNVLTDACTLWVCTDLAVYFVLTMLRSGNFDYVASDYADKYPKVAALEKLVPEHPVYKAYSASKALLSRGARA